MELKKKIEFEAERWSAQGCGKISEVFLFGVCTLHPLCLSLGSSASSHSLKIRRQATWELRELAVPQDGWDWIRHAPTTQSAGEALMKNEMKRNECVHGMQVIETSRRTHVCGIKSFRSRMTRLPFDARRESGRLRKTAPKTQLGNERGTPAGTCCHTILADRQNIATLSAVHLKC